MNTQTEKRLIDTVERLRDYGAGWMPKGHNSLKDAISELSSVDKWKRLHDVSLYYTKDNDTWSVDIEHRIPDYEGINSIQVDGWYTPYKVALPVGLTDHFVNLLLAEVESLLDLLLQHEDAVRLVFKRRMQGATEEA